MQRDIYKTSRVLYIIEAALEYFISIMVGGAYLARLTAELGISDSVTGILSSLVTLGCSFQLVAILLFNNRRAKHGVFFLHTANQLLFTLIYVVPFFPLGKSAKIAVFIAFLLLAHILNNIVQSPKINWFMSLVDNDKRGRFTANKEIISLIGGMIFSFSAGSLMDHFEARGEVRTSFIICGAALFVLTILHSCTLLFSREKPQEQTQTKEEHPIRGLLRDREFIKVTLIPVLWSISHYGAISFYGTYQIKELGFSMTFVSVLSILYAVFRSAFSRPLGKFADKYSFAKMLNICYMIAAVAFLVNTFTVPANGKVFYTLYYILYAIAMAGINSSEINLIYERVSPNKRMLAFALKSTFAGLAGFGTTLLASVLVARIQENGNMLFGIPVYAQQVMSLISALLTIGTIVYLNVAIKNKPVEA